MITLVDAPAKTAESKQKKEVFGYTLNDYDSAYNAKREWIPVHDINTALSLVDDPNFVAARSEEEMINIINSAEPATLEGPHVKKSRVVPGYVYTYKNDHSILEEERPFVDVNNDIDLTVGIELNAKYPSGVDLLITNKYARYLEDKYGRTRKDRSIPLPGGEIVITPNYTRPGMYEVSTDPAVYKKVIRRLNQTGKLRGRVDNLEAANLRRIPPKDAMVSYVTLCIDIIKIPAKHVSNQIKKKYGSFICGRFMLVYDDPMRYDINVSTTSVYGCITAPISAFEHSFKRFRRMYRNIRATNIPIEQKQLRATLKRGAGSILNARLALDCLVEKRGTKKEKPSHEEWIRLLSFFVQPIEDCMRATRLTYAALAKEKVSNKKSSVHKLTRDIKFISQEEYKQNTLGVPCEEGD